jgi:uncharacterized membrane protein (UPF0127 family)
MPGGSAAVTGLGRKQRLLVIATGLLVLGAAIAFVFVPIHLGFTKAEIGNKSFLLEVAKTPEARVQGLSGRTGLKVGQGMLFVFDTPDRQCFWMKDMKFPIDILWFDSNKKLVHQVRSLSPETYPESYCSPSSALYAVELSAGTAAQLNADNNTQLKLEKL